MGVGLAVASAPVFAGSAVCCMFSSTGAITLGGLGIILLLGGLAVWYIGNKIIKITHEDTEEMMKKIEMITAVTCKDPEKMMQMLQNAK